MLIGFLLKAYYLPRNEWVVSNQLGLYSTKNLLVVGDFLVELDFVREMIKFQLRSIISEDLPSQVIRM